MSSYAVFETVIVSLVALVSIYQVMKVLLPRTMQRLRASIVNRRNGGRGDERALATGLPDPGASSGCGVGCGSACNGCGIGVPIDKPLADQHKPSH